MSKALGKEARASGGRSARASSKDSGFSGCGSYSSSAVENFPNRVSISSSSSTFGRRAKGIRSLLLVRPTLKRRSTRSSSFRIESAVSPFTESMISPVFFICLFLSFCLKA